MMIPWRITTGQTVSASMWDGNCYILISTVRPYSHIQHPCFFHFTMHSLKSSALGGFSELQTIYSLSLSSSHTATGHLIPPARAHTAPFVPSHPSRRCHLFLFKDRPQGQPPQRCPHWYFSISHPERPFFAQLVHLSTQICPNNLARGQTEHRPWV